MTPSPSAPQEVREAFEQFYVREVSGCSGEWVERCQTTGEYLEDHTSRAWFVWQAALALSQRVAPSDERIDAIIDECGMLDGPGSLRQARNLARALLAEALQPSPAPKDGDPPPGIYYSREADNFYSMTDKKGQGNEFYRKWKPLCDAFPRSPDSVKEDAK